MRLAVRLALVAAVAVAGSVTLAAPASATECTPKGCSSSCHLNPAATDPRDLLVCYS